jgi:hypothetical protein
MDYSQVIETIGSITKYEHLVSINDNVEKNTLVLRSLQPFPGAKIDDEAEKASYFIILRYRYAPEKINRINSLILKEASLSCFPSYGEIGSKNLILPCVRVKNIRNTKEIYSVQKYLQNNDLQLMFYKDIDSECRIKIFKTFKLAEIGDGLYRDLYDTEKLYIRINANLNWKRFNAVIDKIKYKLNNSEFDAAIGVIYRFMGPENVIRIYDKDKTYPRAIELRKYIIKEVKDEIHLSAAPK